ncbi:MAG: YdcH family protein [Gemmatimonadota bacterium]
MLQILQAEGRIMESEEVKRRIIELQVEHRDLDDAIARMGEQPGCDEIRLRRLKKRKLQIKDTIHMLQMQLVPDIPA